MKTISLSETETLELSKVIERWLRRRRLLQKDSDILVNIQTTPRQPQVKISIGPVCDPEIERILNMRVASLDMKTHAINILVREGISTVGQLVKLVKEKGGGVSLMQFYGFGRRAFNDTRQALCDLGLRLGYDWYDPRADWWKPSDDPNI